MNESRFICIHGHFYQPPRENPWLEAIEIQDSAAPDHDWNIRITRECYGPNARSRILGRAGKIRRIVNNYASISFNFGPTLLDWMRTERPYEYRHIIEADRVSRQQRAGHGNAIAQVYNHTILPLATETEKRLQIHWGVENFQFHFGRRPEGMWLAETAVDTPTLEALAEAGIRFTILAPRQAREVCGRTPEGEPDGHWRDVGEGVDPTRAYECRLPSGRSITLFFYDGPISQAVAFEGLLADGKAFAERLVGGFSEAREHAQLMHIATDGESYGHHHRHGDMALAAAIHDLEARGYQLVNYAQFLAMHPPRMFVRIAEPSSWSCVHGVERWRSDCGCTDRSDWQQRWRAPLREAFEWLRERLETLYDEEAAKLLHDPWQARLDTIHIVQERTDETLQRFLEKHLKQPDDAAARNQALSLIETMRYGQYIFTSCAWFFSEISGIEGVQNMLYAARAMQLARRFGLELEAQFVKKLEAAPSNLARLGTGAEAYRRFVEPAIVEFSRIVALFGVVTLFENHANTSRRIYTYECRMLDSASSHLANRSLLVGHVELTCTVTESRREYVFALLHFGNHDLHCGVKPFESEAAAFEALKESLIEIYERHSLTQTIRSLDKEFDDGRFYALGDLFLEDRRRILHAALRDNIERFAGIYTSLYEENLALMDYCRQLDIPVSRPFAIAVHYLLTQRLIDLLRESGDDRMRLDSEILAEIMSILKDGAKWQVDLRDEELECALQENLEAHVASFYDELHVEAFEPLPTLIDLCHAVKLDLNTWKLQNEVYDLLTSSEALPRLRATAAAQERKAVAAALRALTRRLSLDPKLIDAVGLEQD